MLKLKGMGVSKGVACARLLFFDSAAQPEELSNAFSHETELLRYNTAFEYVIGRLDETFDAANKRYGNEQAQVFRVHQEILKDNAFNECIKGCIINEDMTAYQAVKRALSIFEGIFLGMESEYFRERVQDLREVASKLLRKLSGMRDSEIVLPDYPVIIAAKTVMASEVVGLSPPAVAGFVTKHGGMTSHLAILARMMEIPFVSGIDFDFSTLEDDCEIIIDGERGMVIISPDESTKAVYEAKRRRLADEKRLLARLRDKPCVTKDSQRIHLYANISSAEEIDAASTNGAEGIGIFRSEFFFMNFAHYPDEETQYLFYKELVEKMKGKVVVRTLDAGADKPVPYIEYGEQENPALGMRAVRISLRDRKQFLIQLKALLRAGCHGDLCIMVPMIVNEEEVVQVRALIEQAKKRLDDEGKPYGKNIPFGIMIETPAAAMTADILARHVDFFSIGTNDLTQYSLAVDRTNPDVAELYRPEHRGILRMIEFCVDCAEKAGVWVEVCGDITNESFLKELLALGIDSIAVTPADLLEKKAVIREFDLGEYRKLKRVQSRFEYMRRENEKQYSLCGE